MSRASEIYKAANRLAARAGSRDPLTIIKYQNIKLFYSGELDRLLGLYTYNWKNRIIIVNSKLDRRQMNTVLAHELGHDTLHRKLAAGNCMREFGFFDSVSISENEANLFAAHLLLDDDAVLDLAKAYGYDARHIAGVTDTDENLVLIKLHALYRTGKLEKEPLAPNSDFLKKQIFLDENCWIA